MSLSGLCLDGGPNHRKKLTMRSFEVIKKNTHNGKRVMYMAQGESEKCKSKINRIVSRQFALDWERSTGKKVRLVPLDPEQQAKRKAVQERKKLRREKAKAKAKAKAKKEREKAKKANM